jgi:hypothetical protein
VQVRRVSLTLLEVLMVWYKLMFLMLVMMLVVLAIQIRELLPCRRRRRLRRG